MACKYAHDDPDDPSALCDDAARKVYKTFCSQDDHLARKHLKEANQAVMERLVEIQMTLMNLVEQLETHSNSQPAAKRFCKMAREATNSQGRADRTVLAKVPLLDFEIVGGSCQVTSTAMLVTTFGVFGTKYNFFDLRAVDFQIRNGNCLAIVTAYTQEPLCKLRTTTDVHSLKLFLNTLLTLQSVFALNPEPEVLQDFLISDDDDDDEEEDEEEYKEEGEEEEEDGYTICSF
jgi:hypothetical protein